MFNLNRFRKGAYLLQLRVSKKVTPDLLKICAEGRDLYNLFKCNFEIE